jgi:hypothetical protein
VKHSSARTPRAPSFRRKISVKSQQQIKKAGITQQVLVQEVSPSALITERETPLGDFVKSSRGVLPAHKRACGADDDESRYLMGTLT